MTNIQIWSGVRISDISASRYWKILLTMLFEIQDIAPVYPCDSVLSPEDGAMFAVDQNIERNWLLKMSSFLYNSGELFFYYLIYLEHPKSDFDYKTKLISETNVQHMVHGLLPLSQVLQIEFLVGFLFHFAYCVELIVDFLQCYIRTENRYVPQ